jgi:hypothetical protein
VSDRTLTTLINSGRHGEDGSVIAFFTTCYDMPKVVSLGAADTSIKAFCQKYKLLSGLDKFAG